MRDYRNWTTAEIRQARQWQREGVRDEEIASRLGRSKRSLQATLSRLDPGGGIGPGTAQQQAITADDMAERRRGWSTYCDTVASGRKVDWKRISQDVRGTADGYRAWAEKCRRYGADLSKED